MKMNPRHMHGDEFQEIFLVQQIRKPRNGSAYHRNDNEDAFVLLGNAMKATQSHSNSVP